MIYLKFWSIIFFFCTACQWLVYFLLCCVYFLLLSLVQLFTINHKIKKKCYDSIYTDTLVHRFTSALKPTAQKSFDCCPSHFRTWSSIICNLWMSLRESLDPVANHSTWQTLLTINRKHFFMNILCIESFCPQNCTIERCSLVVHSSSTRSPFWLLKPASEHAHVHLLPRLLWSWIVLIPTDTHRKPISSLQLFYFNL
jgi:hypothetical protein